MTNSSFKISVVLPTYNPNPDVLEQTLNGLRNQDLPLTEWELIIVDNASTNNFSETIDITWHINSKIVKEPKPGLTFARMKGYEQCKGELIILVDDDNILNQEYLSKSWSLFDLNQNLGVAGGSSIGQFEVSHKEWVSEFYSLIAVRPQLHPITITTNLSKGYPEIAPIGAGMVIRRICFSDYYNYIKSDTSVIQDRTGKNLSSGGDNEINIIALKSGYAVGCFPELVLKHIINKGRLEVEYLKRLNYHSSKSWIKLLHKHNICPWKPISKFSVPLRKLKAFFKYKPWESPAKSVKFSGACGMFQGLSELD
ncbi:glycosyltransferase [Mucilaginibacter sp. McL0603]|uniref:glycosyltransferase n=1 Tax=Mucilaginibacter sp. McL0603 TaxID=3415670 RepID=UPI003CF3CB70